MIKGYVSSDEDDYDDYDFGYSEPLVVEKKSPRLPEMQNEEVREKLHSALEESKKVEIFLTAVDRCDLIALENYISKGVSVNCTDSQGWSPLLKACGMGELEMVQFLLENGADPNQHRELLTPLMTCCTSTLVPEDLKLNCIRLLLEHGAQVNSKDKFQTTALMYATGSGYENIVTELLAVPGVEINMQDRDGWTALFHAVYHNYVNLVDKLMAAGADVKLKDRYSRTVINLALDRNFKNVAIKLGYVEEQVPVHKPKKLKDRFLNELPDSNGQGGFQSDAKVILKAFNQFKTKKISLPDLLNAKEKDLYMVGVKLRPDRHKILTKGIHRYHLHPWKPSSMHQITAGQPLNMEDVVAISGTVVKHLTVANASLRYLDARISSRCDKEQVDLAVEKEMIISLIGTYNSAETLKTLLSKILEHIDQIKPEIPSDYIYPHKSEKSGKRLVKYFCYAIGAVAAGFFILCKPFPPFRELAAVLYNHIWPFLEVYEPEPVSNYFDYYFFN